MGERRAGFSRPDKGPGPAALLLQAVFDQSEVVDISGFFEFIKDLRGKNTRLSNKDLLLGKGVF